jgi:hypothetical protein
MRAETWKAGNADSAASAVIAGNGGGAVNKKAMNQGLRFRPRRPRDSSWAELL